VQAWWSVFDNEDPQLGEDPVAVFRDKALAMNFAATVLEESTVRAAFFYESEEESLFLENAENIW
jgi:hypothetical protein